MCKFFTSKNLLLKSLLFLFINTCSEADYYIIILYSDYYYYSEADCYSEADY